MLGEEREALSLSPSEVVGVACEVWSVRCGALGVECGLL